MSTEFRILGPLAVVSGGQPVALGAPKQRAVLAVLLLNRNRVVTRDQLVDAVWGERPPAAAPRSLQVYVHGLRRALGADRIETHGAGYRLRVERGELDLERFEELTENARTALTSGEVSHAAEDVRAAFALWSGSPLADLAEEPVAQVHAPALGELRLAALELHAEVELARGRHAELLAELEALIAQHPYRERLREQQILALYRAGRQTEALDAYQDARRALDELGVEPGPALRDLERRILRHDPSLAAPAAPSPGLLSLPAPPTPLVGRRLEVAAVGALLRGDARLVTLTGPGGSGKTRLALAAAEELGRELPDGAVFVDLSPVHDPALLGSVMAETLELEESGVSVLDALAQHLRPRTMLLVLDNLEQLLEGTPLVADLLARAPRLRVLATSRAPLRLRAEHDYPVPPFELPDPGASFEQLTANDAVRLFAQRARAVDASFELTDESIRSVATICARLDGLPLAIELAAARVKLLPPPVIETRLARSLDVLVEGGRDLPPRQQTLRATLDWSYQALAPEARQLLARLAVFSGGASLEAAEEVCDASLDSLSQLVDASLLRRLDAEPRLLLLETIREYAQEQLARSGEEDAYRRRHCEFFLALAEHEAESFVRGPVDESHFAGLEHEHDNLRAALDWSSGNGDVELEVRLASALSHFWRVRGHLGEGRRLFARAVEHTEGRDPGLRAQALVQAAIFPYRQGDLEQARQWWEEALALFRELGDVDGTTRATAELGAVAVAEGDLAASRALYEEAAEGFEQLGNRVRLAIAKGNLAAISSMRGELEQAAAYGAETIALQEEIGDREGLAVTLQNLARTTLRLGDPNGAGELLRRSLEVARALSYKEVIAYCLEGTAELAAADGERERSLAFLAASEVAFDELGVTISGEEAEGAERVLAELEEALGPEAIEAARAHARSGAVDSAMSDAFEFLGYRRQRSSARSPGVSKPNLR